MGVVLFSILILVVFRIDARGLWLVFTLATVTHNVFESLTGFIFLPLPMLVLSPPPPPPLLLHPLLRLLLSGIIVWDIFVGRVYLLYFVVVF